jgi:hypothetical protein
MGVWRDIIPDRLLLSLACIGLKEKRLSSTLGLPASAVTQAPETDLSDRWLGPADRASGLLTSYSRTVAEGVEVEWSPSARAEVIPFHILIGPIVKLAERVTERVFL